MLDFMKEILGDSYTEDLNAQVEAKLAELYAPRTDLDAALTARKTAEDAAQQAAADLASARLEALVDVGIVKRNGVDPVAIRAHLNYDELRGSKDQQAAVNAALDAQVKDLAHLYKPAKTPPPPPVGTGTNPMMTDTGSDASLRAAFGLPADPNK